MSRLDRIDNWIEHHTGISFIIGIFIVAILFWFISYIIVGFSDKESWFIRYEDKSCFLVFPKTSFSTASVTTIDSQDPLNCFRYLDTKVCKMMKIEHIHMSKKEELLTALKESGIDTSSCKIISAE